ncbi:MAG: type II toxin-antitoxin system RelE/ParE family toxin [Cytophagales bacterium]|nr:type II toxin-antitoxin system RelE/ParE family toxin [Cytophagales bacterium]
MTISQAFYNTSLDNGLVNTSIHSTVAKLTTCNASWFRILYFILIDSSLFHSPGYKPCLPLFGTSHRLTQDGAKLDIDDNIDWYEKKQTGLGDRFYQQVKDSINTIKLKPYAFQVRYKDTRAIPVKTFPFTIHYTIDEANKIIAVLSVFKTPQNPEKWKNRT